MNLRDFLLEALDQIIEAIEEEQERARNKIRIEMGWPIPLQRRTYDSPVTT
jgi:hypothetical protein